MFWKRKQPKEKEVSPKELSHRDIIRNQVEQLGRGQTLSYRLSEGRGGGLVIVELNPRYPEGKREKYIVWEQKIEDGKPTEKRSHLLDFNESKELAAWVENMGGEPVSEPGSGSVDPV